MSKDLRLDVSNDWGEVERVNHEVHQFLAECKLDGHEVDTFTMVACELVENSIKYGDPTGARGRDHELTVTVRGQDITVLVRNPIGSESGFHLEELDRTLQWIRGFQDPFQAYIERVREISREPASRGKSGLGIVRIAYEARAAIDFVVGDDDMLAVSAVAKAAR